MVKFPAWSIVVTFNPILEDLKRLISQLIMQQSNVVLVNNGAPIKEWMSLISDKVFLIQMTSNEGIARAQNEGILFAKRHGSDGVFLFDQDSIIPDKYIETIINTKISGNVGMLVPRVLDLNTGFFLEPRTYSRNDATINIDFPKKGEGLQKVRKAAKPIASGSYIFINALESVGGMREDFFIDAVDTDFSFRLIENGYEILQLSNLVLNHKVGKKIRKNVFGKTFYLSNHNSKRRYYIARNNIWLWKIHRKKIQGINKDVIITLGSQLVYSIFEENSLDKVIRFLCGIICGIISRPSNKIREIN